MKNIGKDKKRYFIIFFVLGKNGMVKRAMAGLKTMVVK
jgi:hypothetical protein